MSTFLNRLRLPYRQAYCFWQQRRTLLQINDEDLKLEYLEGEDNGIAIMSLTRYNAKNAISKHLAQQMVLAQDMLRFNNDLRVVILRSEVPGVFCAGADLKERAKMAEHEVAPFVASARQLATGLAELPIPTIAALDGAAMGGGLEFALCCDMRVASESAKLGLVEAKLAIIPGAGGTQRLPRIVGPAIAKEMIFTGRVVDGSEAARIGLVNDVVPQNDAGDAAYHRALELAREIMPNGPIALRMAKQAINRGIEVDINSGLAFEQACYAQVIPTKDRMEGLIAFREKRPPRYRGE